jgi:trehalose/maltose hydrolase-like predicted phosphorylase
VATGKQSGTGAIGARLAGAIGLLAAVLALAIPAAAFGAAKSGAGDRGGGDPFKLTATSSAPPRYAPTFTGDGVLGVRVPPAGQGYAPGSVPALSELAGFYAQPKGEVQQRANIPTWSTLAFGEGGKSFVPKGSGTSDWRQRLDLRTGVIATSATWRGPGGHVSDLRYEVLTDRARPHVGLVRLRVTPHWSGTATVDDRFDGKPAELNVENKPGGLTEGVGGGLEAGGGWETVRAVGTGVEATLADRLVAGANVAATATPLEPKEPMSIGRRLEFPVTAGQTYVVTKYVDVESSAEAGDAAAAREGAAAAAGIGWKALLDENAAAWAKLWRGRIEVLGDAALERKVNASQFYLWSSTNEGVDWSVSPAGLSSNGYNGHIFWDAETWMFPSLLAQHPELAAGMDAYRFERLAAARAHAAETGFKGARFPWESALDGSEQIPPPVRRNSEGLYEQHIVADVALAQWQYYLATGDRQWLAEKGWPVIEGAAEFWAGRATKGAGGFHITHVTGPDEENPNVSDEAYTNAAAATVLEDATAAAKLVDAQAPARWSTIAHGLVVPIDRKLGIHPEFAGYGGQLVKQADVTLMQYPWRFPMPRSVAQADLNYYVPRSDPEGPSMTDAVSMIDTAALGTPGCSAYVFTRRSYEPFIKDEFDQFSETRTGGAFTFMTGIGGFLQEFLYGYSGLRWEPNAVALDPSLTSQLGGVSLHELHWRGRTFDVNVGQHQTTVTLVSGSSLPVKVGGKVRRVSAGKPLTIKTRRPDLTPTTDPLRCQAATASSAHAGAPALAAVDGSPATDWEPTALPATLTIPLKSTRTVSGATLRWGVTYPPAPKPNVHPPAKPVTTRRATTFELLGSADGRHWQRLAEVKNRAEGTVDHLHFPPTALRYLRLKEASATGGEPPLLEELEASG